MKPAKNDYREQVMNRLTPRIRGLLLLPVIALLFGCTHGAGPKTGTLAQDAGRFEADIRQAVSALRVNARALGEIVDRLHNAAADEAARSTDDRQLGHIQKTYLYVYQAEIVAGYQIRLLSDFPYIKENRRSDFLTLRARDLDRAVTEMEDADSFLEVYAAFIADRPTLAEVEKARQMISGTIYLYEKLLETIRPAVNPAAPFTYDPYSPLTRGQPK